MYISVYNESDNAHWLLNIACSSSVLCVGGEGDIHVYIVTNAHVAGVLLFSCELLILASKFMYSSRIYGTMSPWPYPLFVMKGLHWHQVLQYWKEKWVIIQSKWFTLTCILFPCLDKENWTFVLSWSLLKYQYLYSSFPAPIFIGYHTYSSNCSCDEY